MTIERRTIRATRGDEMSYPAITPGNERRRRERQHRDTSTVCAYHACRRPFQPAAHGRQLYCTTTCERAANAERRRERENDLPDPRVNYHAGDRYVVLAVTGWAISPDVWHTSSNPTTSYTVVDDATGREVGFWAPGDGRDQNRCRRNALELADRLNKDERDWEQERGEYDPDAIADAVENEWYGKPS